MDCRSWKRQHMVRACHVIREEFVLIAMITRCCRNGGIISPTDRGDVVWGR